MWGFIPGEDGLPVPCRFVPPGGDAGIMQGGGVQMGVSSGGVEVMGPSLTWEMYRMGVPASVNEHFQYATYFVGHSPHLFKQGVTRADVPSALHCTFPPHYFPGSGGATLMAPGGEFAQAYIPSLAHLPDGAVPVYGSLQYGQPAGHNFREEDTEERPEEVPEATGFAPPTILEEVAPVCDPISILINMKNAGKDSSPPQSDEDEKPPEVPDTDFSSASSQGEEQGKRQRTEEAPISMKRYRDTECARAPRVPESGPTTSTSRKLLLHRCPYPGCDTIMTLKSNLKAHVRTHTDEKPYVCDLPGCKKRFRWKSSLTYHLSLHKK
uniref:C2H2-type domain-containing protein n=1 Tax=Compsopogon caeruleus TaxID=31354 RepID=A0A7S1TF13_9RHOD|mmetsp:Transcript_3600/g.6833  ORF Transcript_3600/g.6833 Transcript_3600/m.6833 type:complete len:324 (+) Transcript_3600:52-1023(+)